ncbi:MAG TPA: hypothetical protein VF721_09365 [Pyrinomonadaceae bacterium]|jgi:hypothetical protein
MRVIKLSLAFFAAAFLSTACNLPGTNETARTSEYPNQMPRAEAISEANVRYARENLDLRAVGALLERADNAEEFEYLLNTEDVNNLDLNGDGDVDYISVDEFGDRDPDERGLSLFSRFGPDLIQEIATIIFDRDGGGSIERILLTGSEQLYGDNYYYETNRRDRSLPIAEWLFNERRDDYYRSPYYYGNYPQNYEVYQPVETPVYRTRIERVYYTDAAPVFIQTSNPTLTSVKIKSPYDGRSVDKNFSKPDKQWKEQKEIEKNNRKEQKEFEKNNRVSPEFVPAKKDKIKDFSPERDERPRGNPNNFEKPRKDNSDKPRKDNKPKFERQENPDKWRQEAVKPPKMERPAFNQPKPDKFERQSMKPPKPDNNGKPKGGDNNPGRGNGGGNKGGGGGKGGGKKN